MFSLSQVIFLRNWITAGCSLFFWFGLSLVTIQVAAASPVSSDRTPSSNEAEAQPDAAQNVRNVSDAPDEAFAWLHDAAIVDLASADLASGDLALPEPGVSASEAGIQQQGASAGVNPAIDPQADSIAAQSRPIAFATLLPDAATTEAGVPVPASPANQVAQQPVTIPTFANTNECFVDCHPSERFDFRPPAQLSLSPVAPRVAQAPYLNPPTPDATPATSARTSPASGRQPAATETTASDFDSPLPSTALTPPSLHLQGVYIYQGDESSARARITGVYPLTPRIQVGGSLDITEGDVFSEGGDDGVNINELYVTLAPQDLPNLRFVLGQLDLTSYFDRNSFAKDAATQFFNPVFSTNPALAAAGIGSRQGALVNWTLTDNLEARAVIFSSDRSISEFELNAFAGELGLRLGNLIVRGTYVTSEDSGSGDGFQEIFNIDRGNGQFGAQEGDRENAYGINAEYFIPEISLGLFARYGYYENADLDEDGDAFNVGVNVYDLFMESDRLGVGYGQALSNDQIRRDNDDEIPDVLEVFYDFRLLPGIRVGVSYQSLNEFSESIAGFRVRGDFNLTPRQP